MDAEDIVRALAALDERDAIYDGIACIFCEGFGYILGTDDREPHEQGCAWIAAREYVEIHLPSDHPPEDQ